MFKEPAFYMLMGALFILLAISLDAKADPAPYALPHNGTVDADDQAHWYPMACCSKLDCAPVEVIRTEEGYKWDSWRKPGRELSVKRGDDTIQASKDGRYHACERLYPEWVDGEPNYVICFFEPQMF